MNIHLDNTVLESVISPGEKKYIHLQQLSVRLLLKA